MPMTRLAPSPTGALHLGNARTFLVNWLLARQRGWKLLLRIEDLDGPRIKRGADRQLIEDLEWFGLDWDEGPIYQSSRLEIYTDAIDRLIVSADAYPCTCSRKEVDAAASAPHVEDGSAVYPGTCRGKYASIQAAQAATGRAPAIRFKAPDEIVRFEDEFAGPRAFDGGQRLGDFVIAKADGTPAYQLAVVVDDAEMGITHVVRGDDLLDSTPRQILLYRALGLADRVPRYTHLPLVVGPDGRRLAKRHGDTRVATYREQGVPPSRVLALLARWCGIEGAAASLWPGDLLNSFCLEAMPRQSIVFQEQDHQWLLAGCATV
ncbi:MAG TPA: tRNA glutamyl-Q(34) synthetase GluQRS [Tepidisphaeraceae bacterium]|jgi:glutamyl-tRNA synthetase|nr:tRNA glutamyl-Q(34) synthetase GluQRS [Tepidisphaeraceae bacterium]